MGCNDPKSDCAENKVPLWQRAWNLTKAVSRFIASGGQTVTKDEYDRRLQICDGCDLRWESICTHQDCGCYLPAKCKMATESCPIGKWETAPAAAGKPRGAIPPLVQGRGKMDPATCPHARTAKAGLAGRPGRYLCYDCGTRLTSPGELPA